jgi:SAM-dependent methyltransferase
MTASCISVYNSLGAEYDRAFAVFLGHTDQKEIAHAWLENAVASLPTRRVFIDAGAGTGKLTAWMAEKFDRTIAIEPNPHLRVHLERICPTAQVIPAPILDCNFDAQADFVLVSHVFYYVPAAEWQATLDRLASFLSPSGRLVIVLQNPGTDCMRLVRHFHGRQFDLPGACLEFQTRHDGDFDTQIDTVSSHVETVDFGSAYTVSEFMLNLLPLKEPAVRTDLEAYVRRHFGTSDGGFRFSCSQDFLVIRRRSFEF